MNETQATDSRFACATLVTTDSYLPGAVALGESLRRSGWKHDTLALVTSGVSTTVRERMGKFWDRVVEIEPVENPFAKEEQGYDYFDTMFCKYRIWQLTDYERVVYIDSDTIVLGSLDELLTRPSFAAAPCIWPPDRFNAGVLVVEPSEDMFDDLISRFGELSSYDGSDQGFLNSYYPDWYTGPPERRLPSTYNMPQLIYTYGTVWKRLLPEIRILHYTGPWKPWKHQRRLVRRIVRALALRFTEASRDVPTPVELWWQLNDSIEG
jgi:glycogenin glucosyltransferase